jgi:hypothetical protein
VNPASAVLDPQEGHRSVADLRRDALHFFRAGVGAIDALLEEKGEGARRHGRGHAQRPVELGQQAGDERRRNRHRFSVSSATVESRVGNSGWAASALNKPAFIAHPSQADKAGASVVGSGASR